jgi:hypothetical protein
MSGTLKVTTLQDGASSTANLTFDSSANATVGGTLAMASSFKRNRIINGNMLIDQRNAGASVTQTTALLYTVDRWACYGSVASKFTAQQNAGSITPAVGYSNYLGATSSSAYSVLSTDQFILQQRIEGFNVSDLAWGTANAKTVTLSFVVYSSLTGTFAGAITNGTPNRSYPFTFSITSANAWTNISITIAGDTSGTWASNNTSGIQVTFNLGAGSTYQGTASTWQAGNLTSVSGAVSVVGTSGATFYITGVQLEVGTKATPYEMQIYSDELSQCQRYYQIIMMNAQSPAAAYMATPFYGSAAMRATPTMAQISAGSSSAASITSVSAGSNQPSGYFQILASAASGYVLSASYSASSEL